MNQDVIFGINGPVVTVQNSRSFSMMEQVYVGNSRLVGEVIKISDQITTIQVYEETTGLRPGEPVYGTGAVSYTHLDVYKRQVLLPCRI